MASCYFMVENEMVAEICISCGDDGNESSFKGKELCFRRRIESITARLELSSRKIADGDGTCLACLLVVLAYNV
jgi:hypothetical protein